MPLKMSFTLPAVLLATPAAAHTSAVLGAEHAIQHAVLLAPALMLLAIGAAMAIRSIAKKHD